MIPGELLDSQLVARLPVPHSQPASKCIGEGGEGIHRVLFSRGERWFALVLLCIVGFAGRLCFLVFLFARIEEMMMLHD